MWTNSAAGAIEREREPSIPLSIRNNDDYRRQSFEEKEKNEKNAVANIEKQNNLKLLALRHIHMYIVRVGQFWQR